MVWQDFILVQTVLAALSVIIIRLLARDKRTAGSGFAITATWFVVLYIIGLCVLPLIGRPDPSVLSLYFLRFVLGGVSFALSNVFVYYMFTRLDAAVGTILSSITAPLFTYIGADPLLHETLTSSQIIGSIMLLFWVGYGVLATRHKKTTEVHRNILVGLMFALAAAVFWSIAVVNEKSLLEHMSAGSYVEYGWAIQAVCAVVVALIFQPKQFKVLKNLPVAGWTLVSGGIRAFSGIFFIESLIKSNNAPLVTVASNLKLIIVVLLGAWLLKERQKLREKLIAAVGASLSLILLFW